MAIPASSGAAQASDLSAQVREASGKGSKGNKQGEATDRSSFLQMLKGVKGSEEGATDQAEAGEASMALRLLTLLSRLDSGQLDNLAQGSGKAQGEKGQLLTLLQNLSGGADISGKALSGDSEQQALLRGILMQSNAGEAETNRRMEQLLSLMQEGDGKQGSRAANNGEQQMESILRMLTSGEGQDKLSDQVLRQISKDLESLTTQQRTGVDSSQLGRLAAEMQQAEGKERNSGANLARLFLESFSVEGKGTDSGKGGRNSQQQNVALLQSLAKDGQLGANGVVTQAEAAGRDGGNSGVSTKAGEWANLFSAFQSTASGSTSLSQATPSSGNASVTDSQVLQQMITKFQAELQRGSRQINMKMHPPELGRVQLNLISEDNGLQAHLQVQNAQVQSILERNMAALKQALEQQNLDFDQIDVSVESGDDGREEQNREERDFRASDWRSGGNTLSEPEGSDEHIGDYVRSPAGSAGISLRV